MNDLLKSISIPTVVATLVVIWGVHRRNTVSRSVERIIYR